MASKVSSLSKVLGHYRYDAGAHMYNARDGARDGGTYGKEKQHRIRKAIHKIRSRASGMTADIGGAKEAQGTIDNPYEKSPPQ